MISIPYVHLSRVLVEYGFGKQVDYFADSKRSYAVPKGEADWGSDRQEIKLLLDVVKPNNA